MEPTVRYYNSNTSGGSRRRAPRPGDGPKTTLSREAPPSAEDSRPGFEPGFELAAPDVVAEPESPSEEQSSTGPVVGVEDFEDIFTRFQTPLCNFVFRLVGNREQAYDLTQDVFVKAYRALAPARWTRRASRAQAMIASQGM
jgi:RNA polymerase sigma-70 factor (ECF subfamily)